MKTMTIMLIGALLTLMACAPASATPTASTPTPAPSPTPTATPTVGFTTSNLTVTPNTVKTGEPATVGVTVTNNGEDQGTYTVVVKLHDGTTVGTKDVTLAGGARQNITLDISLNSAGTHMIMVDKLARNLVVQATAASAPTQPTPPPTQPTPPPTQPTPPPTQPTPPPTQPTPPPTQPTPPPTQPTPPPTQPTPPPTQPTPPPTQPTPPPTQPTPPPTQPTPPPTQPTPPPPPTATGPAAFTIAEMGIDPGMPEPGDNVTVSVKVANTGGQQGTYTVALKVDDVTVKTQDVTLAGGTSQVVNLTIIAGKVGTYTIKIGELTCTMEVMVM
ncbi:MAG: CARDB domain-containing protein [Dehalococcoidales bacterium]|nr:CARDB domain-containing protein [Dehalococcoidales bacterium]